MKLDILNTEGKSTGRSVDLPEDVFGIEPNEHVMYLAVKSYLAHQRQGTHKSKERGEIKGSTRKIKKQKGTGTARAGSLKNPLFRSGGRVFGPKPRTYVVKLNRKVRRLATASALSQKAAEGKIRVMEDFSFEAPKTKQFVSIINNLELAGKKSLIVTADYEKNVYLSGKNIQGSGVLEAKDLTTYKILNSNVLVVSESAIKKIKETLANA